MTNDSFRFYQLTEPTSTLPLSSLSMTLYKKYIIPTALTTLNSHKYAPFISLHCLHSFSFIYCHCFGLYVFILRQLNRPCQRLILSLAPPDVVYCPRVFCASAVIVEPGSDVAQCSVCSFAFCVACRQSYHGRGPCPAAGPPRRGVLPAGVLR